MKPPASLTKWTATLGVLALASVNPLLHAEESLGEKVSDAAKDAWSATKDTAKEVGNTLEKKVDELRADEPAPHKGNKVDVSLKDSQIAMPTAIPAGPTTFVVTNEDKVRHGFGIGGRKLDESLTKELAQGETALLTVDLPPGTYEVKSRTTGDEPSVKRSLTVK